MLRRTSRIAAIFRNTRREINAKILPLANQRRFAMLPAFKRKRA
jgi:hypothetical protein